MDPARIDLAGDRGLWFVSEPLVFVGDDLTGASFRMQVRQLPDAGGDALADLGTVVTAIEGVRLTYADSDTVENHVSAGRLTADDAAELGYESTDDLTLSIVEIRIQDTTMAAMPGASVPGQDVSLAHDLLVTLAGVVEQKHFYGTFTVRGTVTQ